MFMFRETDKKSRLFEKKKATKNSSFFYGCKKQKEKGCKIDDT